MSIGGILLCLALFIGLMLGLGLPLAAGLPLRADEKLCAGAVAALTVIYLAAFGIYLLAWPPVAFTVLPLAALILLIVRRRVCREILRDPATRRMIGAWLIVAGWTLGFLALVKNYSGIGSGTIGDWIEHYQRTEFFLLHRPLDFQFIRLYALTARPPLANLVTGAFLALTHLDYAHYQVFSALESFLVFLPALLLVRRFSASLRAEAVFLLLFLLNPLVLHNSTYPWTKLITAFFVLASLYFFVRSREEPRGGLAVGAFVCLAAGLLAHYSAGPYLVALVLAWIWWRRSEWSKGSFWAETALCAAFGGLLLATWFGWAIHAYGFRETFLSNTSVTADRAASSTHLLAEKGENIFNTLVPFPLRQGFAPFIIPRLRVIFTRDYAFMFYQLNLFFALGSAGGWLSCWLLWRRWRETRPGGILPRTFWVFLVVFVIVIGLGASGGEDDWGLVHICLQPLIVLGLAFLAANYQRLAPLWRGILWLGLTVDFLLGIALHFYVEHLHVPVGNWTVESVQNLKFIYGQDFTLNLLNKHVHGYAFVGDGLKSVSLLVAFLAVLFGLALLRLRSEDSTAKVSPIPPQP